MATILHYRLSDGLIQGMWTSNTQALVDAQIVPGDTTNGYLQVDTALDFQTLRERWYVHEDLLVSKAEVAIQADANPFEADGVTICTVTVSPFVPCTLLIDGAEVVLTPADDTAELTSEVPHTFQITLAPLAQYWAVPITVEAT